MQLCSVYIINDYQYYNNYNYTVVVSETWNTVETAQCECALITDRFL